MLDEIAVVIGGRLQRPAKRIAVEVGKNAAWANEFGGKLRQRIGVVEGSCLFA